MKATTLYIVQTRMPDGWSFTASNIDVPRHNAKLPYPSQPTSQLHWGITRQDGAVTETLARLSGISLAATGKPPGKLLFDDLSLEDAPVGSEILLLGYEI